MAQETCLDCFRKHVATAMVFEDEAEIGNAYPLHKWLAIGELHAAEKEVRKMYPLLAQITREQRILYQKDGVPVQTLMLITLANELEESEENEQKEDSITLNKIETDRG